MIKKFIVDVSNKTVLVDIDDEKIQELYLEELARIENQKKEPILMDVASLCEMMQVSRPTAEKLYKNNPDFPAIKVGKKWLFHTQQVKEYLKEQG